MRDSFQLVERQKAGCALDGMNRPKNAGERLAIARVFLERNQVLIEPVQVLVAFNQEFFDDFGVAHQDSFARGSRIYSCVQELRTPSSSAGLRATSLSSPRKSPAKRELMPALRMSDYLQIAGRNFLSRDNQGT